MRFSLRQVFYGTTCIGIACAALIYASTLWAAVVFTVTIALLLAAIVLIPLTSGAKRAYWLGFAVFGWGYFAVLHSPILAMDGTRINWHDNYSAPPLISTVALEWMYHNVLSLVHRQPQVDAAGNLIRNSSSYPTSDVYCRVGHSLFALLAALGGGVLGSTAFRKYRWSETSASEPAMEGSSPKQNIVRTSPDLP